MGCFSSVEHNTKETYKILLIPTPTVVPEELKKDRSKPYSRHLVNATVGNKVVTLTVLTQVLPISQFDISAERLFYVKTDAMLVAINGDQPGDIDLMSKRIAEEIRLAKPRHLLEGVLIYLYAISPKEENCRYAEEIKNVAARELWNVKFIKTIENLESAISDITADLIYFGVNPREQSISQLSLHRDSELRVVDQQLENYIASKKVAQPQQSPSGQQLDASLHPRSSHLGQPGDIYSSGLHEDNTPPGHHVTNQRKSLFANDVEDDILLKKNLMNSQQVKDLRNI